MTGTITRIISDRGFAFLRDTEGTNRFVHRRAMVPESAFDSLDVGDHVEFDPIGDTPKNSRALNVRVVEQQDTHV
jgi:cold shock CspA family protein